MVILGSHVDTGTLCYSDLSALTVHPLCMYSLKEVMDNYQQHESINQSSLDIHVSGVQHTKWSFALSWTLMWLFSLYKSETPSEDFRCTDLEVYPIRCLDIQKVNK